jgi:hypothetical protein
MILFEALSEKHNTASFSCGTKPIDDYIRREAIYDHRADRIRTFLAIDTDTDPAVPIGYFSLKASQRTLFPRTPADIKQTITPVELVYLARDLTWRKTGLGLILLTEAMRLSVEASERIGLPGIYLESTTQGARLYERVGFQRVNGPFFYMPIRKARAILEEADQPI